MKERPGVLGDGADHQDQAAVRFTAVQSGLTGQSRAFSHVYLSQRQHARAVEAIAELLAGYGAALDSIAGMPPIAFLSPRAAPGNWRSRGIPRPYANFITAILAVRHMAVRIDLLIRRGQRFCALDPDAPNPIDLDRLGRFRDSLTPVRLRTLVLWVIVLGLCVAFPVAWLTDQARVLAPQFIVCSDRLSIRTAVTRFVGTASSSVAADCHPHPRYSVVRTLEQIAHVQLSPGGVIDTFSSARAGGVVTLLLLTVTCLLSVSVVLLIFISGFRLKRMIFSPDMLMPFLGWRPDWPEIRSEGIYRLEREAFASVDARWPREFPLDLAARAGILALPFTIAIDLTYSATLARLDFVTRLTLLLGPSVIVALIALRLGWLVKVWRSRSGARLMEPRQRSVPDGTIVRVSDHAYSIVFTVTAYIIVEFSAIEDPTISFGFRVIAFLAIGPIFAWSVMPVAWYRLHRELVSYSRYAQVRLQRRPVLSLVPSLSLAIAVVLVYALPYNATGAGAFLAGLITIIGCAGVPVTAYRLGRDIERLQQRLANSRPSRGRARTAGMRAVALAFAPFIAVPYLQHSLNQAYRQMTSRSRGWR
jgi:hypothetical protein